MAPKRTRQRKVAWTWPPGQPNRSYRSRWRKAVSRSSRHISTTTRRPSQTHSGFPAGPLMACAASTNSSDLRWLSLAASAGLAGTGPPRLLGLILGAKIAALGNRRSDTDQQGETGHREATQNRIPEPKQQPTHKVPDFVACSRFSSDGSLMPFKWVPNAAGTLPDSHDGHF